MIQIYPNQICVLYELHELSCKQGHSDWIYRQV